MRDFLNLLKAIIGLVIAFIISAIITVNLIDAFLAMNFGL